MSDSYPRQSIPLWGKIALGCLGVVVLGTATCIGAGYLLFKKGGAIVEGIAGENWSQAREAVDQVMTDDGARRFYADHPGLARTFPDERSFLEAARRWRPFLEPLPERIPMAAWKVTLNKRLDHGAIRTEMSCTNEKDARVTFTWTGDTLVGIDVQTP